MSSRFLLIAAAAALAGALATFVTTTPASAAKDDPAAAAKAGKDALKKELKDKKYFVYYDLSYYVDAPKLKESRWDWKDPPPFNSVDEKQGGQFFALWVPTAGGEAGVEFKVIKMPHYEMKGSSKTVFNNPFNSWGKTVLVSKVDDMAQGFYEDWVRESTEPIKDACHPPKKQNVGPGEWYATAVATDKDLKKRVRKDWYVWSTSGAGVPCTWVAIATISDKFRDTEEVLTIVKNMMTNTIEIKDKRAGK